MAASVHTHGYAMPDEITEADTASTFEKAMALSAGLHEVLLDELPVHAQYAVALAYRVRYSMQFNAREAMHMLELRTGRQGHQAYRRICQKMHRLIADQAGHRAVAEMMTFVDHDDRYRVGPSCGRKPQCRKPHRRTAANQCLSFTRVSPLSVGRVARR